MNDFECRKVQPIRRPRKRQKHKLNHHRNLARTVGARIFVFHGKLFPISRLPSIGVLLKRMLELSKDSFSAEPELIAKIAWAGASDGQLTRELLIKVNKSINSWQAYLDAAPRSKDLTSQRREVQQLRDRADACFDILNRQPGDNIATTTDGFLLTEVQQLALDNALSGYVGLTCLEHQLARMVFWFSGLRAVERFLLVASDQESVGEIEVGQLDKSIEWLESLVRRSKFGVRVVVEEFRGNERFRKLMKSMSDCPFEWPKSKGLISEKIKKHILRLKGFKDFLAKTNNVQFPSVLAAWAICDQGTEALPVVAIREARCAHNVSQLKKLARSYCRASKRRGYNRMLGLINRGELNGSGIYYNLEVLELLDRHPSDGDVLTLINAFNPDSIGPDIEISKVKKLIDQCRYFLRQPEEHLRFIGRRHLSSNEVVTAALAFFTWLNRFPAARQTKKGRQLVLGLLDQLMDLINGSGQNLVSQIQRWSDFQSAGRRPMENEALWPSDVRKWLRRTLYYQEMASPKTGLQKTDLEPRLPKTFRKRVQFIDKRAKELQFLQSRNHEGMISPGQLARLNYLQSRLPSVVASEVGPNLPERISEGFNSAFPVDEARQLRDARRACFVAGKAALARILTNTAKSIWADQTGVSSDRWSRPRLIAMIRWIDDMSSGDLKMLKQTMNAFTTKGENYERQFDFNNRWVAKATGQGINVGKWLSPQPMLATVNGMKIKLEIEKDPLEIYQMGTYFNTCLAQGGCNETSVLANAARANLQVIYARTEDGALIGRQLIAINQEMKLIGYNCYVNTDQLWKNAKLPEPEYKQIVAEFARFAARIASAANVRVCFDEDPPGPESLGNLFWYDDGVHQWDQAATEEQKRIEARQAGKATALEYVHGEYETVLTAAV